MILSILIPVYNEKNTILEILKKINEVNLSDLGFGKEIIIVDDGSTDGTRKILNKLTDEYKVIYLSKNQGKGAAIRSGLKAASGDYVIIQDADLEYNPKDYPALLKPLIKNETDIVYGSRSLTKNPRSSISFYLGGKLLTFILNLLFRTKLTDISTCYKVFKREVLRNIELEESGFAFCEEVTCKALKKGYRIKEVPINYYPRTRQQGKKVYWEDGLYGIWVIFKYRLF